MKKCEGTGSIGLTFLTLAWDGGEWSASPRERASGSHWMGEWVSPGTSFGCSGDEKVRWKSWLLEVAGSRPD